MLFMFVMGVPWRIFITEDVMGYDSKLPSCKPTVETHDTLNEWNFKDSQEPWPKGFCVSMPSNLVMHFWWPTKQFEQVPNKNEVRFYSILKIKNIYYNLLQRKKRKETMVSHSDMEYEPINEH